MEDLDELYLLAMRDNFTGTEKDLYRLLEAHALQILFDVLQKGKNFKMVFVNDVSANARKKLVFYTAELIAKESLPNLPFIFDPVYFTITYGDK